MNREQLLISKWRDLNSLQQQEVLDFVDLIAQKSFPGNIKLLQTEQKVQKWLDWANDNPDDSPGLPDEALSRDSIYSED